MAFCPAGQLEKYGWESGSGLGREQQGIKEAIKVKLKFDTTGVGHDPGEQFTHHWWDVAFNTAAKNIQVTESEKGVEIKKNGDCHISTKKNAKLLNKPGMLYGSFIKAATLTDGSELAADNSDSTSDSDDDCEKATKLQSVLSDEQLFKACGGRTAHKGARHGLKLNGKLARIAQQENNHSLNSSPHSDIDSSKKKDKKQNIGPKNERQKKKKKSKKYDKSDIKNENYFESSGLSKKRKKKKKTKDIDLKDKESVDVSGSNGIGLCTDQVNGKNKSQSKKRKKDQYLSATESDTFQNCEPKKKKKKKYKNS